jgi:hypothetical protein
VTPFSYVSSTDIDTAVVGKGSRIAQRCRLHSFVRDAETRICASSLPALAEGTPVQRVFVVLVTDSMAASR